MRDALPTVVNELGRLIAVPQNAATFDAFLRAFRSRRELSWSPEGPVLTPNPDAACAEGLESALRRYRGTVIPPFRDLRFDDRPFFCHPTAHVCPPFDFRPLPCPSRSPDDPARCPADAVFHADRNERGGQDDVLV